MSRFHPARTAAAWVLAAAACLLSFGCAPAATNASGSVFVLGAGQLRELDVAELAQTAQLNLPEGTVHAAALDARHHTLDLLAGRSLVMVATGRVHVRRRVPLPIEPAAIQLDEARQRAFVAGSGAGGQGLLLAVDLVSGRVLARLRIGARPVSLALSASGEEIAVAEAGARTIELVDLATWKPVSRIGVRSAPTQVVTLPFGDKAFALCGPDVAVLDLRRAVLLTYLPVGPRAQRMAVKPDGGEVYVSNAVGSVSVINTATNNVSATLPAGLGAAAMAVSPDGSTLYVANADAGTVSVLSLADRTALGVVRVGEDPAEAALSPDGRFLLTADTGSNDVAVVRSNASRDNPNTLVTLLPAPPRPALLISGELQ